MEASNSKNVMEAVESCIETVRQRLTSAVERTLHPMKEGVVSKLGSVELVFLMLVSALSSRDAEVSVLLLMEAGRRDFFSRVRELEAGLDLPWEVLDRAAKFAVDLERSGLFSVPQELHRCLAQLLSAQEAGGSEDPSHDQVTSAASQTVPVPRVTRAKAQRQLWEGVKEDDVTKIEGAVLSGADLEERRGDWTPLTKAAYWGRVGAVRVLLRLGARVEGRGGMWQGTALPYASAGGHEAVVRELVAAGADLNPRTSYGNTPLALAEREGHRAVADYLRSVGATRY